MNGFNYFNPARVVFGNKPYEAILCGQRTATERTNASSQIPFSDKVPDREGNTVQ